MNTIRLQVLGFMLLALVLIYPLALAKTHAPELEYTISDKGLSGPSTALGGYTWVALKSTAKIPRVALVLRLEDGATLDGAVAEMNGFFTGTLRGPPKFVRDGIGGPGPTTTGQRNAAGMVLKPGLYMVFSTELGRPDYLRKSDAVLLRVAGASGAAAPTPDYTVKMTEFKFTVSPSQVKAGKHLFRVENEGKQSHFMFVMPLKTRTSFGQARQLELEAEGNGFNVGMYGPAMGTFVMDGGYSNDVWLDLKPGEYMMICYIRDSQKHGMMYHLIVNP